MQDAVPVGSGSMIAVLGAEISLIEELIKKETSEKDICEIANDNAEGQVILSGKKNEHRKLSKSFKEKKNKIYTFKSKRSISLLFNESLQQITCQIKLIIQNSKTQTTKL